MKWRCWFVAITFAAQPFACRRESGPSPAVPSSPKASTTPLARSGSLPTATATLAATGPGTARRIRITVIADGYDPNDAARFATFSARVNDIEQEVTKFAGTKPDISTVKPPANGVAGKSSFNIGVATNATTACKLKFGKQEIDDLWKAAKPNNPELIFVVEGGLPSGVQPCSTERLTVMGDNTGYPWIPHELGHSIAGLFDEWAVNNDEFTCLEWKNCSNVPAQRPWKSTGIGYERGCFFSFSAYRPTNACTMGSNPDDAFCPVCKTEIAKALASPHFDAAIPDDFGCPIKNHAPWLFDITASASDIIAIVDNDGGITKIDEVAASPQPPIITGEKLAVAYRGGQIVGATSIGEEGPWDQAKSKKLWARTYYVNEAGKLVEERVEVPVKLIRIRIFHSPDKDLEKQPLQFMYEDLLDARNHSVLDEDLAGRLAKDKATGSVFSVR
jgi:hypothetical protein